jgi:ADP-ribose pyrophosphatase YjhB (NUDIX family)
LRHRRATATPRQADHCRAVHCSICLCSRRKLRISAFRVAGRFQGLILGRESVTFRACRSLSARIPGGDNRERLICADCGHIAYDNPKVVVGSVVVADGSVLMCRRAIEPRRGFWTLPAGYLEHGETLEEGAAREAWEEAQAEIALDGILGVFSISRIGQIQVIFRARFAAPGVPRFAAGPESLEVALFPPPRIPRDAIAFPSVIWALDAWETAGSAPLGVPSGNPAHDPRGTERLTTSASGICR